MDFERDAKGKRLDLTDLDGMVAAVVVDSIADADTTHAPSRNAVFDALALKRNVADHWLQPFLLNHTPNVLTAGVWTNQGGSGFSTAGAVSTVYSETWYGIVSPGTWAIDIYVTKSNNSGIFTFEYSIDGGSNWVPISANTDLFGTGVFIVSLTGISVTAAGRFDLRLRSTGTKNASSAGYYCISSNAALRRTA